MPCSPPPTMLLAEVPHPGGMHLSSPHIFGESSSRSRWTLSAFPFCLAWPACKLALIDYKSGDAKERVPAVLPLRFRLSAGTQHGSCCSFASLRRLRESPPSSAQAARMLRDCSSETNTPEANDAVDGRPGKRHALQVPAHIVPQADKEPLGPG